MDQVFISNHVACIQANADTALFSGLSHNTGASDGHDACMVGVYNPSNNRFLDGTTAALSLIQPNNVSKLVAADGTWATNSHTDTHAHTNTNAEANAKTKAILIPRLIPTPILILSIITIGGTDAHTNCTTTSTNANTKYTCQYR